MLRIYHNPRCSKSRETLGLLTGRGLTPEVIEYLQTPPGVDELGAIIDMLGIEPRALMRRDEAEYTDLGLSDPSLGRDALLSAMVAHPRLIQRPIVVNDGRAAIGRPPEAVLAIL
ncbi:arsenate reductase [Luteibacter sp. Sphag1AF]|uniref:arsenate reductase (glutaredoxin) n=1 Tax=Luteibacter sp. Sphag1AF TaxID=2587031 RepID=UPI001617C599|nr:arsenate reductase (glutaredoxin) [Luteibacter sp. Sphag1AF]MBB3227077.1 arsenate reductase [Luteibacter sp. Sphag1AF]